MRRNGQTYADCQTIDRLRDTSDWRIGPITCPSSTTLAKTCWRSCSSARPGRGYRRSRPWCIRTLTCWTISRNLFYHLLCRILSRISSTYSNFNQHKRIFTNCNFLWFLLQKIYISKSYMTRLCISKTLRSSDVLTVYVVYSGLYS